MKQDGAEGEYCGVLWRGIRSGEWGNNALSGSNVIVNAAVRSSQHQRQQQEKEGQVGERGDGRWERKRGGGERSGERAEERGGERAVERVEKEKEGSRLPRLRRKRQHLSHASVCVCVCAVCPCACVCLCIHVSLCVCLFSCRLTRRGQKIAADIATTSV